MTVLRDPARGGFDSVTVSLNEDYMPVRDRLATLFDGRDPDDLLLLYYTGHGILGRGNRLFLATPGSDLDKPQVRGISASELREQMDQTRAERQVLLLDCCHSGAFAQGAKGAAATPAVTQDTFDAGSIGRYVLAAADALQFAWDGDSLAEGAGERRLSRFTGWVVDGLGRGEASPDDEQITMDALFRYVARRAKAEGSAATPQRYVDRGTGELVIGRNPAAAGPAWVEIARRLDDADWSVRAEAVEAAGKLLRRDGPVGQAARAALDERLTRERDFAVRNRIVALLGVREKPPPVVVQERPPPQEPVIPHVVMPYLVTERESAVLMDLGIAPGPWVSLPPPVMERVRLYARALRTMRWLTWLTGVLVLFDIGAAGLIVDRSADSATMIGCLVGQVAGAGVGLFRLPMFETKMLAPLFWGYEAVMRRYEIVKFFGSPVYEAKRLRQLNLVLVAAGSVALLAAAVTSR